MTVTNDSRAAWSYQLVPAGERCDSGVVLENGWIEAGETRRETFRGATITVTADTSRGTKETTLCNALRTDVGCLVDGGVVELTANG